MLYNWWRIFNTLRHPKLLYCCGVTQLFFPPQVVFQTAWRTVWIRSFSHRPLTGQAWTLPSTQSWTEPTGAWNALTLAVGYQYRFVYLLNCLVSAAGYIPVKPTGRMECIGGTAVSQFGRCRKGCEWFGGCLFVWDVVVCCCVYDSKPLPIRLNPISWNN